VKREARIDLRDLQQQIQGEFHAFLNGRIVRGFTFHAAPPLKEDFQMIVHEMLQVLPPSREQLDQRHGAPKRIAERLAALIQNATRVEEDDRARHAISAPLAVLADPRGLDRMETAIAGLWHWIAELRGTRDEPRAGSGATAISDRRADASSSNPANRAAGTDRPLTPAIDLLDAFEGLPELPPAELGAAGVSMGEVAETAARAAREISVGLATDLGTIEQALGRDPATAAAAGQRFAHDIASALEYPLPPTPQPDADTPERLRRAIRRLIQGVSPGPRRDE
jgi:hypothetical protein